VRKDATENIPGLELTKAAAKKKEEQKDKADKENAAKPSKVERRILPAVRPCWWCPVRCRVLMGFRLNGTGATPASMVC
jgi:hypothetical protein